MDREWHIHRQLELLSSPTTVQFHRIDTYSSVVEGVRRVRRILTGDSEAENDRLIRACCQNDIETVKWLFEDPERNSINLKKGINRSALHESVLHHDGRALVRLLCQHGADPKQRDSLGRTPIHYAASCGHLDIINDLINFSRVSVSSLVDTEGRCPLMYACGEGHLTVCQWLVEHGNADYHRKDERGRSCLSYACRSGHVEVVEWLLPVLSPEATDNGWHPLHFSCSAGHLNVVKVLLKHDKQSIHALTNTGHSVLFMAMHSMTNSIEIVKCLLDVNSLIDLTSKDIDELSCDKRLILLIAQRRHSIDYLLKLIQRIDYPLPLIQLLLLSEHIYSPQDLLSIPHHQSIIREHIRNPLKLKQISRRLIRKSSTTSKIIDQLEINDSLKNFLHFECLY